MTTEEMRLGFILFMVVLSLYIFVPAEWFSRVYSFFIRLPVVSHIRRVLVADPPLFGERESVERLGPKWESIPAFVRCPKVSHISSKTIRIILRLLWMILTLPYSIYYTIKQVQILHNAYWGIIDDRGYKADLRATTLIQHYEAGWRSAKGGSKGGASKKRSNFIGERDEEIRSAARELLAAGREFHELPSLLAKYFGTDDGYPKSARRYRTIIKRLKKEKEPIHP